MKCPECGGVGRIHYGEEWCSACNGTGEVEMTEQEYIQTCNTEQLAEWIKGHMNCNFCPMRLKCEDMRDCMEHIKAWLKQPHKPIS